MKKRVSIILLFLLLLTTNNYANADVLSDLQAELKSVLTRISELRDELAIIENTSHINANSNCLELKTNLRKGMQNNEVQKLQIFLAKDSTIYPEGITSGYFGRLTELAVQRWQAKNGIVSSGTPATTGYGSVGPQTRRALNNSCNTTPIDIAPGVNNVIEFNFVSKTGNAPYESDIKFVTLENLCMSYRIDWGDGSEPTQHTTSNNIACGSVANLIFKHKYLTEGDYTAILYAGKGPQNRLSKALTSSIKILKGAPYVKVLNPNGGEILKLGDHIKIKWQSGNFPIDSAIVFYIVGSNGTYRFAKRSHRTNEFDWIVGDRVCDGNGCNVNLDIGPNYKIRAVLYSPANACVDFCDTESTTPSFLANDESDTQFTISQLGSAGSDPLQVHDPSGIAPFMTTISIKIEPINNGVGNFEVDFGDNSTPYNIHIPAGENRITERTISHTYANTGDYYIRLRPIGAAQYISKKLIQVTGSELRVTPSINLYAPTAIRVAVDLDNTCSYNTDLTKTYTIDWGDNTATSRYELRTSKCTDGVYPTQTFTNKIFNHSYANSGSYNISLTTRVGIQKYKLIKTINIQKPTLHISPQFGFKPLTVHAKYTSDESCSIQSTEITYTVDWGDGADSIYTIKPTVCDSSFNYSPVSKDYSHTYQNLGRYNVSLSILKSDIGTIRTTSKEVVVDTSVIRNSIRKLTSIINETSLNMATAIRSVM